MAEEIIIPGAEHMTKEELAKAKRNERQRRLMARRRGKEPTEKKTKQEIRKMTTENLIDLATDSRNLIAEVLMKKLQILMNDEEQLSKTNLIQLTTAFGTLVDKANLLKGMATENIAISAKIDINMTSDNALDALNNMRQAYTEGKD